MRDESYIYVLTSMSNVDNVLVISSVDPPCSSHHFREEIREHIQNPQMTNFDFLFGFTHKWSHYTKASVIGSSIHEVSLLGNITV